MEEKPLSERSWNRRTHRAIFVVVGFIFGVAVLGYGGTTAWYWWGIKHGTVKPPERPKNDQLYGSGFSTTRSSSIVASDIDRKNLETGPYLSWAGTNAKVTIVEFMDFKCPFSRDEAAVLQQVMTRYAGKVNIYIRNFPGESIYPGSRELSRVAYCAFRQNRFPKVYDYLFTHQSEILSPLTADNIHSIAVETGLYEKELVKCLTDTAIDEKVAEDLSTGVGAGVRGTPTFFVNGQKVEGDISFDSWQRFIDSNL
jgi:predicted DsbA family dithiol-disulfide isomerase